MPIPSLAFLIDVDNTLLDNDTAKADEATYLRGLLGEAAASRFWEFYEEVRKEEGVVDFPLTLARFDREVAGQFSPETLYHLSSYLLTFPFPHYVYPGALDTLAYLNTLGTTRHYLRWRCHVSRIENCPQWHIGSGRWSRGAVSAQRRTS